MTRTRARAAVLAGVVAILVVGPAVAASAHPLGNFTVNHYDGLHLYADHIDDLAVIDTAEIPTLQAKPGIDTDHDGTVSDTERTAYATSRCKALAGGIRLSVGDAPAAFRTLSSAFTYRPGAVNLSVSRLECGLRADVDLRRASDVAITDTFASSGVGWHEITAVATGVALQSSPVPAASVSDTLLHYPNDLLSSPLNIRSVTLPVTPSGASSYAGGLHLPGSNPFSRAINRLNTTFNSLAGSKHLTLGVGILAVLVAFLLGAGHALLPGHGKTMMAAYLVGRRGTKRDMVTLGATVTATHTTGVIVFGLIISASSTFAPSTLERVLGVVSGGLVVVVGVALLGSAVRRRRAARRPDTPALVAALQPVALIPTLSPASQASLVVALNGAGPATAFGTAGLAVLDRPQDHPHGQDHAHDHGHGPGQHRHGLLGGHRVAATDKPYGRAALVGLGVAGGLVPSPSALVVLLGAIALGRTVFGVLLVLVYGLGLAATLTVAGLLMVPLRARAERLAGSPRFRRSARVIDALPVITATLVVLVGLGLAYRSLTVY